MNDYKNHRPVRRMPDWLKITVGLLLALPFVWFWAVVMLSF